MHQNRIYFIIEVVDDKLSGQKETLSAESIRAMDRTLPVEGRLFDKIVKRESAYKKV